VIDIRHRVVKYRKLLKAVTVTEYSKKEIISCTEKSFFFHGTDLCLNPCLVEDALSNVFNCTRTCAKCSSTLALAGSGQEQANQSVVL